MKQLLSSLLLLISLLPLTAQSEVTYIHTDILGSPIMETNEQGSVISRTRYKPFGETLETPKNDVGYTGHLNDTDLGLTYMQARYYDPLIGRFYSNDPVGFTGEVDSFNRYLYVANNPYKYTDPDGKHRRIAQKILARQAIKIEQAMKRKALFEKNKLKGKEFEEKKAKEIKADPNNSDVAREITVKTKKGVKTRLDIVSKDTKGTIKCTECKSSDTAPLTKNQKKAFPEIAESGATVVGKGKPGFPGGTKIPPTKVEVVRPKTQ
ncbi:RHS repeat domain-containing protein [Aliikangiella sp. IMCC44359]|uniref:RHS repeat domain-containing protein n=1 Tax=Aliikangiella sp. IMCC44359 TaxID=3459125 RepID=UPI00403B2147